MQSSPNTSNIGTNLTQADNFTFSRNPFQESTNIVRVSLGQKIDFLSIWKCPTTSRDSVFINQRDPLNGPPRSAIRTVCMDISQCNIWNVHWYCKTWRHFFISIQDCTFQCYLVKNRTVHGNADVLVLILGKSYLGLPLSHFLINLSAKRFSNTKQSLKYSCIPNRYFRGKIKVLTLSKMKKIEKV